MKWKVTYSGKAKKFLDEKNIHDEVRNEIRKFLLKMNGENINIDLRKLVGNWKGYYRIRIGQIRVIFKVFKEDREIYVEKIDFRGSIYK